MVYPLETEKTLYINEESNIVRTGLLGYYDPINLSDMYGTSLSALNYVSKELPFSSASSTYPDGINLSTFNLEIEETTLDIFEKLSGSLIAYWPLNETSGSIMNEEKYGYDGTYLGTYYLNQEGIGDGDGAVNYNATGESDAYNASLSTIFNGEKGSFGAWVAMNSGSYYTSGSTFNLCFFGNTATMYSQVRVGGSYIAILHRAGASIPSTTFMPPDSIRWVHVIGTWDKPNDKVELYINGSKQRPATGMGTWSGSLASNYARIGDSSPAVGNVPWAGRMARVFLTNEPLTVAQSFDVAGARGQLLAEGDSRTALKYWPSKALESAYTSGCIMFGNHGISNQGKSGYTVAQMILEAPNYIDPLLQPNERNILVLWGGVNDAGSGSSAAQIYTNISNYCLARKAAGWNYVCVCTEIDAQSAPLNAVGWHGTIWPALNTSLRSGYTAFADHLIDLGADARLQNALDTTYYNADAVHLVMAGELVVAQIVADVLELI